MKSRIEKVDPQVASRRAFVAGLGVLFGLAGTSRVAGQQGPNNEPRPEDSRERLEGMRRLAQKIKLVEISGGSDERPVALRPEPLHRYGNRPLGILDGTLWAWGERGRPVAVLKVELWPDRDDGRGRWSFGISSSAFGRIAVTFLDGMTWASTTPGFELHDVPDAPRPADTAAGRLSQAKALSRRLSAHGEHPRVPGGVELRLLPTPIHRYADPESGLLDGLIFGLVAATNPEALVYLEAWNQGPDRPTWRYGFTRQGTTAVTVRDDQKIAWTIPYAPPPSRTETYMNRSMPKGVEAP